MLCVLFFVSLKFQIQIGVPQDYLQKIKPTHPLFFFNCGSENPNQWPGVCTQGRHILKFNNDTDCFLMTNHLNQCHNNSNIWTEWLFENAIKQTKYILYIDWIYVNQNRQPLPWIQLVWGQNCHDQEKVVDYLGQLDQILIWICPFKSETCMLDHFLIIVLSI